MGDNFCLVEFRISWVWSNKFWLGFGYFLMSDAV